MGDYAAHLELPAEWCGRCSVEVWAYCLMPNHVHLVVVPARADRLRRGIGEAHRRYTRRIDFREGWRGHLWQGRFASFVMDEDYLLEAVRYIERSAVRAKLPATGCAGRSPTRANPRGPPTCSATGPTRRTGGC